MNGCVCRWFVEDNPGEVCPVAGRAAYRDCLRLTRLEGDTAEGHPQYAVNASSFMAFHSILKTSQVSFSNISGQVFFASQNHFAIFGTNSPLFGKKAVNKNSLAGVKGRTEFPDCC